MSNPLAPTQPRQVPHTAYQVDYVAANCGKIVPASKRRIRFKFGYTNTDALNNGKIGRECRGSEHEVNITWSLSSGKQAIAFDQHEVFFNVGDSTQTKLSHAWKDQFGHTLQVKIHAASMSSKANPDPEWKQYDLLVDGVSYFNMPKIFELGIFAKEDTSGVPLAFRNKNKAHYNAQNASAVVQGASAVQYRNHSINSNTMGSILPPDEPKKIEPEPVAEVMDLLSFDDFDVPAPAVAAPPQQMAPVQAPAQANYAPVQTPAPAQANYAPPVQTNFAPAQTQQSYAPASNAFENSQAQYQKNVNSISPDSSPGCSGNNYMNPSQPPMYSAALVPAQPAPTSAGGAMNNLVNMDDFFGTAAPITKASVDTKMQGANAHKSLGQLQGSTNVSPRKPVMNTFNSAPAYQQQQPQGMYTGYAPQQPQPQFNNYQQQQYAQPGFGYQ